MADVPTETQQRPHTTVRGVEVDLPLVDVRRKRPPALAFLLRMETLRTTLRVASLLVLDFAGVFAAIYVALMVKAVLRYGDWAWAASLDETRDTIAFAYLVTALLFARSGLYSSRAERPGLSRIVSSLFQVMVVALVFALVNGEKYSSYYIFYGTLAFGIFFIGSLRWLYEQVTGFILRPRRLPPPRRAGRLRQAHRGRRARAQGRGARAGRDGRLRLAHPAAATTGCARSAGSRTCPRCWTRHRVQEVIIADPDFPQDRAVELVDQCHRRGVTVRIAPSTMEILVHRAEFVPGASVPLFELRPPVFDGFDYAVKRTFDFVVSLLLLIVLSPLLLLIAAAVAVSSRGPVLYKSMRPGIGGESFACLKFRTMRSDADQIQADLESLNEASGALFKIRHDPRLTRFGRFLRRYSIDELPQLLNVLAGQMSLVGPRPLPQRDFDQLEEWHKKRYLVLPGITGLWQVSGRSELDFDDLVRLDFLYLERWSVGLDLAILLKTVPAVISRRGAF